MKRRSRRESAGRVCFLGRKRSPSPGVNEKPELCSRPRRFSAFFGFDRWLGARFPAPSPLGARMLPWPLPAPGLTFCGPPPRSHPFRAIAPEESFFFFSQPGEGKCLPPFCLESKSPRGEPMAAVSPTCGPGTNPEFLDGRAVDVSSRPFRREILTSDESPRKII